MSEQRAPFRITVATFGLAIGGPVTLLSGLVTFASIPRGIPPAVAVIFIVGAAVTGLSALVYLAESAKSEKRR